MKKLAGLAVALLLCVTAAGTAFAQKTVNEENQYFYEYDKSAYDGIVFGDMTFYNFLFMHANSSFDVEKFMNSEIGEDFATHANLQLTWPDNMNEGLLEYWRNAGMEKILETEGDSADDCYVYVPVDLEEGKTYPMVLVNHGGGTVARTSEAYGWIELAGREGIILMMAENTEPENLHTWMGKIMEKYPVDPSRVYSTGSSQGGMYSKQLAGLYPKEIAAIAPMNISFTFNPETDGDPEVLKELKMPMLFVAGTADVYHPLPMSQAGNANMGSFEGWNNLVDLQGVPEYAITAEESAELVNSSLNLLEYYTGLRLPEAQIHDYINHRAFQCDFPGEDGVALLSVVIEENGIHDPLYGDVEYAWNFLKQFSRNTETGELIVGQAQ